MEGRRSFRWLAFALPAIAGGYFGGCGDGAPSTSDAGLEAADAPAPLPVDASPSLPSLECEVAVVGGGAGGLHTAYRLAESMGMGVCLFEREAELGGRIRDVPRDPSDPMSPRYGAGALRVMEGQEVVFSLAMELGIRLEMPDTQGDLIEARGLFATSKEAFVGRYPGLMADPDGDTETVLYDALRMGPERANVTRYTDFRSYIRRVVGGAGYDYLRDMSRFRADFEAPLDARGYLDYLDEEWDVCCTPSYPVGGMSEFIRGMAREAMADGARIFANEPVLSVSRASMGGYRLLTSAHEVRARRVVLAVPPVALARIEGDVVEEIRMRPEFQAILPIEVVTVTQWWDRAWWRDLHVGSDPSALLWRAWTTDHCVNFVEFPLHPYGVDQRVTRSVYDDDIRCVALWQQAYRSGGIAAVEAEVQRGLEHLFANNGVTMPAGYSVPRPVRTHYQYWPDAWHWLRAGATVTNQQVYEWAAAPLGDSEEVGLVGEAYHPRRSGWSDGAYKSSIHLLNTQYGMSLSLGSGAPLRSERVRRGQGGH